MIIVFNVTIEVPDVDAVSLADGYYLTVIGGVEEHADDWVSVPYEALEEVRSRFLGLVIPHANHTVLACTEKIA